MQGARAERAWRELGQWVEDVVVRRTSEASSLAWYRHPLAVDQLAAYYLTWSAEYLEDAVSTAPAAWHDRWFPHLMCLVDADTKACTARKHDEGDEKLAPSVHEREQFEAFIETNVKTPKRSRAS